MVCLPAKGVVTIVSVVIVIVGICTIVIIRTRTYVGTLTIVIVGICTIHLRSRFRPIPPLRRTHVQAERPRQARHMWSLAESGRVGRTYVLSWCAWCGLAESGVPARTRTRDCAEGNEIKAQGLGKEDSAGSKGKEATAGLQGKEGSVDPQTKEGSASPEAREKDQNEAGQEGSAGRQGEEARAGFQPRFEWDDDHWDPELDLRHHLTRMRNNQEALAAALEDPSPLVRKALEQSCSYRFLP